MVFFDDEYDSKRSLGIRDRQILYRRAKGKCENPACGRKIEFDEMQVGHKTAWSRGGRTTLRNSVCLCYRCNKLQGTDSWSTFMKKQGVVGPKEKLKKSLQALNITQLRALAKKHNIVVKGRIVDDIFDSYRAAPTKNQYINRLTEVVTEKEITAISKETPKTKVRKRKRKRSDDFWF